MAAALRKDTSIDSLEEKYHDITVLYNYAEELLSTVESGLISDPEKQLAIVEPLISEIGDAADILAEEFIFVAENETRRRRGASKNSKSRVEGALRRVFAAIGDYQLRVRDVTKKAHGSIMNIADPIVHKIQRQMEQVVVIFLEYVQISLHSVMNKAELDALKQRDARVALMMHQQALAQQ